MSLGDGRCTSREALAVELEAFGLLAAAFEGALHVCVLTAERQLVISNITVVLLGIDGAVDPVDQLAGT